jgi:hypothetical protein
MLPRVAVDYLASEHTDAVDGQREGSSHRFSPYI